MADANLSIGGETAIITAAGRGIGFEIANQLSQAGVDIVINDIDADRLSEAKSSLQANNGEIHLVCGDMSDPAVSDELVAETVERYGSVDILVNNVGIAGPTKPTSELTKDEFMDVLNIDVGGIFNPTSAAIPYLKESDHGRVVNLSSMTAKNPLPNRTPYSAAKMGVIGFTRALALELAGDGVTANAICPGSVWGERLKGTYERRAKVTGESLDSIKEDSLQEAPLKTFVEPEDVADLVIYLCSERAKKITGQDLNVTAGKVMY